MANDLRETWHGREITFSGLCSRSGKFYQVTVTEQQFKNWKAGKPLRQAMPFLSLEQREFVACGITPDEGRNYDEVTK